MKSRVASRRALVGWCWLAPWSLAALAVSFTAHGSTQDPAPLLTYAATQHFPPLFDSATGQALKQRLSQATSDLAKDPPPETDCARTLGAKRFAALFDDLGGAYSALGDDTKAAAAYVKAIACNPRASFLHAELAATLLNLGQYERARTEAQRQLIPGRADFALHNLIVQLDFIEHRWQEAIGESRLAVIEAPDDVQATYWQCFHWLAQQYAGSQQPVLVARRGTDNWPQPVLELLQGRIGETDVVEDVRAEHDVARRREILSEALFYTGQARLAANRKQEARRYFQATVDLGVRYFIEHHLALAELRRLRDEPDPSL